MTVTYRNWSLSVSDLLGKVDRGELITDPAWQRGRVWSSKDNKLLIDSIIRGIPLHKIFVTENFDIKTQKNIQYVVDGQQRINAIHSFLSNEFFIKHNGRLKFFRDLPSDLQHKLTRYELNGHIADGATQDDISLLFSRINATGVRINCMEGWNNEYYDTDVLLLIKSIWEEVKGDLEFFYDGNKLSRMIPLNDILDLCNSLSRCSMEGGTKKELETFLEHNKNLDVAEAKRIKNIVIKTIRTTKSIVNEKDIKSSYLSKSTHFISLLLTVGLIIQEYYIDEDRLDELREDLLNFNSEDYEAHALHGTKSKANRRARAEFFNELIMKYAKRLDAVRRFPKETKQVLWREGRSCAHCGEKIKDFEDCQVDHIQPWSKGGKTEKSNAQLLHSACNKKKGNKIIRKETAHSVSSGAA